LPICLAWAGICSPRIDARWPGVAARLTAPQCGCGLPVPAGPTRFPAAPVTRGPAAL